MSENSFWVSCWALVAAVLISIVGFSTYSNHLDNQAIKEMVAKGAFPLDAACAIRPGEHRCIVRYADKDPQVAVVK